MKIFGLKWFDRLFHNERGATSVLVIFMMIVLVTLGAFAITSANVNIIFGKKAVALNAAYYALDAEGERYVAAVDYALALAESSAIDYMMDKGYLAIQYSGVPDDLQNRIYQGFEEAPNKIAYSQDIFGRIYFHHAFENLEAMNQEYPTQIIMPFSDGEGIRGLATEISLQSPDDSNNNLLIALRIEKADFTMAFAFNEITGMQASQGLRYSIEAWSQKQAPFTYEAGLELWDGSME